MAIIRYNPLDPLYQFRRLQDEMERLWRGGLGEERRSAGLFPAVNFAANDRSVTVRCEMPGVPLEKIDINMTDDTLTLKGERQLDRKETEVSYHRRERRGGYFNRTITFPFEVDPEKAQATYRDGVLEVKVERAAKSLPRQITVKTQ